MRIGFTRWFPPFPCALIPPLSSSHAHHTVRARYDNFFLGLVLWFCLPFSSISWYPSTSRAMPDAVAEPACFPDQPASPANLVVAPATGCTRLEAGFNWNVWCSECIFHAKVSQKCLLLGPYKTTTPTTVPCTGLATRSYSYLQQPRSWY